MANIYFSQMQHPVGQGGLHTGMLYSANSPGTLDPVSGVPLLVWAYDCGSDQPSPLKTELRRIRGITIDVLFLSHLDNDHVVGVDALAMTAGRIDEVVLPYLGDDDWALHLAAAASNDTLSGTFVDLAADPAAWFGRRGVRRITYVQGSDDEDDDLLGPDPVDPSGPGLEAPGGRGREREPLERLKIVWTRPKRIPDATIDAERAEIIIVPRGAIAAVYGHGTSLDWVLSPFSYRLSRAKMAAFKTELTKQFGLGLSAAAYAAHARTPAGRTRLKTCYDSVWKTHNLHSMALYAGPPQTAKSQLRNTAWHGKFVHRVVRPGFLSTGDFDFTVEKRRDAFIHFYRSYAPNVGQLALPHHGSEHSFNSALLTAFSNLIFALAAVGTNGYGHPSLFVQREVATFPNLTFVRVDENPSSWFKIAGPVP